MSIHPNAYNLKQVLTESGDLYVPWFQRDYTWSRENVDDLFLDLSDEYSWDNIVQAARNKTSLRDYFMGAIMLCGNEPRMVLDGQQRLTTITMMLANVLKRMRSHQKLKELYKEGEKILVNSSRKTKKKNNRLTLKASTSGLMDDSDNELYSQIIESIKNDEMLACERDPNFEMNQNLMNRTIYSTYNYISQKVTDYLEASKQKNYDESLALQRFYEVLTKNLIFVSVRTDDEDYAIKFFETLNARGEELRPDDLVKNALFLQAGANRELQNIVVTSWDELTRNLGESRDRIDFLRFQWNSENAFIGKTRIYRSYKQLFLEYRNEVGDKIKHFCQKIKSQSVFYKNAFRDPSFVKGAHHYNFCRGLNHIGAKICRPVMLATQQRFAGFVPKDQREAVYQVTRILEAVMMRCSICERVTTALEKGFAEIAVYINNSKDEGWGSVLEEMRRKLLHPSYGVPTDQEFENIIKDTVLSPTDLDKQKWRAFFATLDRFCAKPNTIFIPKVAEIKLEYITPPNSQYQKSIGNIRVRLEDANDFPPQTINPPLGEQVLAQWDKRSIDTHREHIAKVALDCWKI
jgi:uncharacterized protein with ParB-like and HNH nuclease domain